VYLTNALEPAQDLLGSFEFGIPALAHEAQAVNGVKNRRRFTAIIGNPPYSKLSSNWNEWINELLHGRMDGARTANYYECNGRPLGERTLWIQDDYIKFMRLSQLQIDLTGIGIHAFITNNGYLDNPTLRGMRQQLKSTFQKLYVLDLHGSTKRGERASDGAADKNVFDIQQGVAIGIFTRLLVNGHTKVLHAGLMGDRKSKYQTLTEQNHSSICYVEIASEGPANLFIPIDTTHWTEYEGAQKITEIFSLHHSGIITKRDSLTIHWSADEAFRTVSEFVALNSKAAKEKYGLPDDVRDWKVTWAQADLRETGISKRNVIPVLYRPFDVRFTYFTGRSRGFVGWPVANVTRQMLSGDNLALVTTRMTKGEKFDHVLVSRYMNEVICLSARTSNNAFIFPLYSNNSNTNNSLFSRTDRSTLEPNINPYFTKRLSLLFGIPFRSELREQSTEAFGPTDIFNYIVALLSSPRYRQRYSEFLSRDFPHILIPATFQLFHTLANFGNSLVSLHLLESLKFDRTITEYFVGRALQVEKVSWSKNTVWLDKAQTTGFTDVCEEVWNFHIGGYRVCEKWLKDRKGRTLLKGDIAHYQKIIVALSETIRLMKQIDEFIEQYGGWPGAFQQ
jgi:predicted helicase